MQLSVKGKIRNHTTVKGMKESLTIVEQWIKEDLHQLNPNAVNFSIYAIVTKDGELSYIISR